MFFLHAGTSTLGDCGETQVQDGSSGKPPSHKGFKKENFQVQSHLPTKVLNFKKTFKYKQSLYYKSRF